MSPRRSLRLPIILAIVMIVLLVALTVGWVLLTVFGANWTLFSVGTTFIVFLLVGVVMYLGLSVKSINFTRRQSNFIDAVTHEFKSPIASMKLYLQTLNHRQVSREEQAGFYRFMLEDLDRLDHLVNQVLEAGRLDAVRTDGKVENVLMSELLRECADTLCLRHRVPADTVQLDLEPCSLRARRVDLELIFRNLIDNAVKYAGSEPHVEVVLRIESTGNVVLRIRDNGAGVPHRLRRKIFGRFVRLGLELERKQPGTGLGLHIVQTLVRRLGGRVRVRDGAPGSGAVFEVELPASLVVASQLPSSEDGHPAQATETT